MQIPMPSTGEDFDWITITGNDAAPFSGKVYSMDVEPFSGSGTTIMAAEITGRCCYAMELNPAYVDVAIARWENFTGQKAMREMPHV